MSNNQQFRKRQNLKCRSQEELTKGQQAPTTIIPNSVPDFPIAVTLNVNVQIEIPETQNVNTAVKIEVETVNNKKQTPVYASSYLVSKKRNIYQYGMEDQLINARGEIFPDFDTGTP